MVRLLPNLRLPTKLGPGVADGATRRALVAVEDWAEEVGRRLARLDTSDVGGTILPIAESDVTGLVADLAARPTGSGTINSIAKWTSGNVLGDSGITDNGSLVTISPNVEMAGSLQVAGNISTISDAEVGGTLTLSPMTSGSVLFAGPGGLVSEDNAGLFYDDAGNRFGLGTTTFSDNTAFGGATDPTFEIERNSARAFVLSSTFSATADHGGYFWGVRGRGSRSAPAAVASDDLLAAFGGAGYHSALVNRFAAGAQILVRADAGWTNTSFPARLEFQTVPASSTSLNTRMTITPSGVVVLGSPSDVTKAAFTTTSLEVTRDATNVLLVSAYGTSVTPAIQTFRGRGTGAVTSAIASGDILGQFSFVGASTATGTYTGSYLQATATEAWSGTRNGTKLELFTTANLGAGRAVRLTIDHDGTATFANNVVVTGSLTANGNTAIGNAAGDAHSLTGTLALNATAGSNGQIAQISGGVPVWGAASTAGIPTGAGTANTLAKWTGASTQGNSSVTDTGTVVDVGVNTTKFGATFDGALYVDATIPSINFRYDLNSTANGAINYSGYNGSNTQFRNLGIYDGKNANIVFFTGSSKTSAFAGPVTMASTLAVNGNTTLGDDTAVDTHTANGALTINASTANSNALVLTSALPDTYLRLNNTAPGGRNWIIDSSATASGVPSSFLIYDDTAAASRLRIDSTGAMTVYGNVTLGDAGTDTLTVSGYAGFGVVPNSTAQVYIDGSGRTYALYVTGVAQFNGNCTLGDATSDSHTINGLTTLNVANTNGLNVVNTAASQAGNYHGVDVAMGGSYDTTVGALFPMAVEAVISATKAAGANALTNTALYAEATGGDTNYGIWVAAGSARFDGNVTLGNAGTDVVTVNGGATCTSTLAVTGVATLSSSLNVTGAATLSSTLRVTDVAQFDGDVNICDDAADLLAFHGAAGVSQQTVTGSRGGSAALADLITKLANLGIIVDGTSP